LQFSQIRFTLDRTFMAVAAFVSVRVSRLASTAATPGGTAPAATAEDAGGTRPARPGDILTILAPRSFADREGPIRRRTRPARTPERVGNDAAPDGRDSRSGRSKSR